MATRPHSIGRYTYAPRSTEWVSKEKRKPENTTSVPTQRCETKIQNQKQKKLTPPLSLSRSCVFEAKNKKAFARSFPVFRHFPPSPLFSSLSLRRHMPHTDSTPKTKQNNLQNTLSLSRILLLLPLFADRSST